MTLMGLGASTRQHPIAGYARACTARPTPTTPCTMRPADRCRLALRRPGHRQGRGVRPEGQDHPHRHRPSDISKNVRVDIPVVGDAKQILNELIKQVEHRGRGRMARQDRRVEEEISRSATTTRRPAIKPQYVIEEICHQTNGDAIIATGVGQHQMWAASTTSSRRPRQFISSGGLGTMGFGLPAAIGAQFALPDGPSSTSTATTVSI